MKRLYIAYMAMSLWFCVVCYFLGHWQGRRSATPVNWRTAPGVTATIQRSVDGTNWGSPIAVQIEVKER